MSAQPSREHCNVCHREVFICARCGKPSCMGGKTQCPGCEKARAFDDAADKQPAKPEATGGAS